MKNGFLARIVIYSFLVFLGVSGYLYFKYIDFKDSTLYDLKLSKESSSIKTEISKTIDKYKNYIKVFLNSVKNNKILIHENKTINQNVTNTLKNSFKDVINPKYVKISLYDSNFSPLMQEGDIPVFLHTFDVSNDIIKYNNRLYLAAITSASDTNNAKIYIQILIDLKHILKDVGIKHLQFVMLTKKGNNIQTFYTENKNESIKKFLTNKTLLQIVNSKIYPDKEYLVFPYKIKQDIFIILFKNLKYISNDRFDMFANKFVFMFLVALLAFLVILAIIFAIFFKQQKEYYKNILNSNKNIIIITDKTNGVLEANKMFYKVFNINSIENFKKKHFCLNNFFVDEDGYLPPYIKSQMWIDYITKDSKLYHKAKLNIYGEIKYYLISVEKISTTKELYAVVLSDITTEENYRHELIKLNNTDFLTNTYNRRYFNDKLEEEIKFCSRYKRTFSLIVFDIDHFKQINDKFGHDVGDQVLVEYSKIIHDSIRDLDMFFRIGGEEFAIILPETQLPQAVKVAQKLNKVVRSHKKVVPITISLGVVEYLKGESATDIYIRVDKLLYKAKESGRDKVVFK